MYFLILSIMEIYNKALEYIIGILGDDETNEDQLNIFCGEMFGDKWDGVYPSDIPPIFSKGKIYRIYNLDPSWMGGSHWIAVIKRDKKLLIYDSFGRSSKKIIPSFFGEGYKILDTEYDAEQRKDQNSCGQRCIAAIFVYDQFGPEAFMKL